MSDVDRRRWRDDRERRRDVSPSSRNDVRGRSRSPRRRSPSPQRSKRRSRSRSEDRKRSKSSKHHKQDKKKKHKKEKKKKKKRSRSSSSDDGGSDSDGSGADSDSSTELLMRLEKERLELREKRKRDKERLKATETAEEKRTRRLIKKEQKANRDKERMGWDNDYVRYTNEDNPFGDSSLTSTFRWDKKLKQDGMDKLNERELTKIQKVKQEEQRQELEKVKQRRLEREREREERDQLMELEDRKRENDKFASWQRDEDKFHLQQARLRSQIRISDGRAKPIDLLAKYIAQHGAEELDEEAMDTVEMHEPYTYLNGLALEDLEDLLVDIEVYVKIDLNKNKDFWSDIVTIVQDELSKLRKMERTEYEEAADRRQGINSAVAQDVQSVFKGKTAQQLSQLQLSIEKKLDDNKERGGSGIDVSYWESLLSQLKAHLARARLRDKHSENLRKKLAMLKAEQNVEASSADDEERAPSVVGENNQEQSGEGQTEENEQVEEEEERERQSGASSADEEENDQIEDQGYYSPVYVCEYQIDLGSLVVDEGEEIAKRVSDQSKALTGAKVETVMNAEEKALEREAKKGMTNEEAVFSVETALESTYEWSDKYRPRKPRYFNRVHTGFEWNKYNQTHYDVDNPPPKIVQGYKFNIFYPDLIDKKATPEYKLIPCGTTGTEKDFCILRIHAGPPYEDIAFKIVNREWEYGYKRGFRCQFHNNIFQLWFHFKRLRYRR